MLNSLQPSISSLKIPPSEEAPPKASKMYYAIPALIGAGCIVSRGFAIHALIYNRPRSWEMLDNWSYVNYALTATSLVATAARAVFINHKYGKKPAQKALLDSVCKPLQPEGILINSALGAIFGLFL